MINRFLALFLLFCASAFGVDTLTVTSAGGQLSKIEWNWTADSSGNASGVTTDVCPGVLYAFATVPDTSLVPSDNYDIVIKNQFASVTGADVTLSTDLAGGLLADRDQTNTELVEFWPTGIRQSTGKLRVEISNAGNAKKGKATLIVYRTLALVSTSGSFQMPVGGASAQLVQWFSSGQGKWITLSGDATISNGGVLTVASGAITAAKTSITGTPDGTKFLRDDWSWQNVGAGSGIGDVVGPASAVDGAIPTWDGTTGKLLRSTGLLWNSASLTVPGGVALSTGNAFYTPNGSYGLYESTVTSGNQRALFKLDNTSESSTWGGNAAGVYLTDNSGLSGYYAIFLPRDPSVAAEIRKPLTATGVITGPAATTSKASFNAPHGTAPSAPTNGDIWTTTGGAYVRVNGATQKMPDLGTAETITGNWVNTASPWADNEVADTLTSSIFKGSGTTTDAVDLATAEVAGVLPDANVIDALTISGGTINNSSIGATTRSTILATTIGANNVLTLSGGGTGSASPTPQINMSAGTYDSGGNPSVSHISLYGSGTIGFGVSSNNLDIIGASGQGVRIYGSPTAAPYASFQSGYTDFDGYLKAGSGDIPLTNSTGYILRAALLVKTPVWLSAASITPTTTNGCTAPAVNASDSWAAAMAASTNGFWQITIPSDYDGSTENVNLWYYKSDTNAVTWSISEIDFADNAADTTTYNSATTQADTPAANNIQKVTISASALFGTSATAGNIAKVKVGTNAYSGTTAYLMGVKIEY